MQHNGLLLRYLLSKGRAQQVDTVSKDQHTLQYFLATNNLIQNPAVHVPDELVLFDESLGSKYHRAVHWDLLEELLGGCLRGWVVTF